MDEQRPPSQPPGQRRAQKRSFSDMNAPTHPLPHAPASSRPQGSEADPDEPAASPFTPLSDLFLRDSLTPPPRRFSPPQPPNLAMATSDTPSVYRSTSRHDPQDVIDLTMDDSPAARPPRGPELSSRARHEAGPDLRRRRVPPTVIDLESPEQAASAHATRPVPASRDASVQTGPPIRPGRHAGSRTAAAAAAAAAATAAAAYEEEDDDVEIMSWNRLRPSIRPHRNIIRPPLTRHGGRGQVESGAPDTLEPAMNVGPISRVQAIFDVGNFASRRTRARGTPAALVARTSNTRSWMEHHVPNTPSSLTGLGLHWDYDATGFENPEDFFGPGGDEEEVSSPQLEALPPVREGFTRELNEGDELVCPNCDRELSAGNQTGDGMVWVVRACGHVYCGACGDKSNRVGRSSKAKGKGRAKEREDGLEVAPLTMCVVDKCLSRTTGEKSMFPLYL